MVAFLFLTGVSDRIWAEPKGPMDLPERLEGLWKVSLCINHGHCWIRFENRETGEIHTMGRYPRKTGGRRDEQGQLIGPHAKVSGIQWDLDLKYEPDVQNGKYLLLSVLVKNPPVYRGRGNGFGYSTLRNNCASFARNAWHYYSGDGYPLARIPTPEDLRLEVLKRHPHVAGGKPKSPLAGR
ncbi:MAG: hypothetical protein O7B81_07925 [Gammaproteobacteria bacterium]|nr:hypothetical protein [Gammaproteobacteria bacterium]